MKRSISALITAALVVAGAGLATPATALTASLGGATCNAYAYKTGTSASASRGTCSYVKSKISYRDSGGTLRHVESANWATSSSVSSQTTMVVYRGINIRLGSASTGWYGY